MYIFICNRYESKNEDLYIISQKMPFDKDKIYYYKYDNYKNLDNVNHLRKETINNNNICQNSEESDELQIIDYPYQHQHLHQHQQHQHQHQHQPQHQHQHQQIYNNHLKKNNSNRIRNNNSFINNNNKRNYHQPKNADENIKIKNLIHKVGRKKHSFSFITNPSIKNKINNKINFGNSDSDIDDTIKGEDNVNITKYKMRYKNIQNNNNNLNNKPINIFYKKKKHK